MFARNLRYPLIDKNLGGKKDSRSSGRFLVLPNRIHNEVLIGLNALQFCCCLYDGLI